MKKKMVVSMLVVLGMLVVALFASAQTASACKFGCTPGYWKQPQHFDNWAHYNTTDTVGSVFPSVPSDFAGDTLLQALKNKGGGMKALLRHAVALLLTTAYDRYENSCQWYSCYWTEFTIDSEITNAISQGDEAIERLKDNFAVLNELGCPLD